MADKEKLARYISEVNIAEDLTAEQLTDIGQEVKRGFEDDMHTRSDWEQNIDDWTKLAKQTIEPKTYPWPNASNIKYPLLSTAAMQFAARAYPSLVPSSGKVVASRVVGQDLDGQKYERAKRVSTYMSYQLMDEMYGWEEDMDRMLIMLPIVGCMFKKTYWDSIDKRNCSKLVLPKNLVVDYWTTCLEKAERISEVIEMSPRILKERQLAGLFLDVDLGDAPVPTTQGFAAKTVQAPPQDDTTPYVLIEQHTFLDLDEDGYREPYIVTIHKESGEVLRIAANFDENGMVFNDKDELIKISPIQYFTKFGFIPNPDGGFYDIGFGTLLGPLNESVNTLINQLVDAGTLSNLQAGFLGKGLRIKMGETRFQPGEWKSVNATGDDLKKSIFPLPTREPSPVLLQLMTALITSGKELASVAEIFTGKMPGQNTPATTTMATVEQGMKVFTAVYKRIFRSLAQEFNLLYRLNSIYMNPQQYMTVVDGEIGKEDFNTEDYNIYPGADPTATSEQMKLMKAQGLMELLSTGILDPVKVVYRILEAQEQPNWQELIRPEVAESGQPPPPPPDPKMQEMEMTAQLKQQELQMKGAAQQQAGELKARDAATQLMMKQQANAQELQHKAEMNNVERAGALHKQRIFSAEQAQKINLEAASGVQKLSLKEQEHRQKIKQAAQQPVKKQGN